MKKLLYDWRKWRLPHGSITFKSRPPGRYIAQAAFILLFLDIDKINSLGKFIFLREAQYESNNI